MREKKGAELAYVSETAAATHELMSDLHRSGLVNDRTMAEINRLTLAPVEPLDKEAIRAIRRETGLDQTTFAAVLGVTMSSVSQWERGEKQPSGPALRLLSIVRRKGVSAVV